MSEPDEVTLPPRENPTPSSDSPPEPRRDEDDEHPAALPIIKPRPRPGRPRGRGRRRVAAARRTEKPVLTPRMSFFVNDDNSIDFQRTKPETIEQLRKAISQPEAQRRLGLANDVGEPTPPRTWTNITAVLVDSVNALAVQAAVNTWRLTDEQARLLFLRTDPDVYQQTTQLTGELLDKYFPGGFGEYDKEISLLLLVGGFTMNAVQKIRAMNPAPREVVNFSSAAGVQ